MANKNLTPQQRAFGASTIPHEQVTTAFEIPGRKIARNLGLVRGITVRSRSIIGNFGAGIIL